MSSQATPPAIHRSLPPELSRFSALTILVDPPTVASPAADARTLALLRRARDLGVTSFDVAGASNPERAERILARAFPEPDPRIGAVIGRSVDSLSHAMNSDDAPPTPKDLPGALAMSIGQSRRRLAPVAVGAVEWTPGAGGDAPTLPTLGNDTATGSGPSEPLWILRLLPASQSLPDLGRKVNLFSGAFSILDGNLGSWFEAAAPPSGAFLVARDPFSEGRLDGSRFAVRTGPGGPASPPVDVRRLHQEFDPVLRLGFLTAGRRRTLAQAALQFALHWSWVATVVVPLPEPERFDEIFGFGSTPALSPDELEQIRRLK